MLCHGRFHGQDLSCHVEDAIKGAMFKLRHTMVSNMLLLTKLRPGGYSRSTGAFVYGAL
jgi:hypothetical protein